MKPITDFSQIDTAGTYTYADYLTWRFKERVELLWGKIFKMTPAPHTDHQQVSSVIHGNLFHFLKKKTCKVFAAPFDVRLPNENGEAGEKSNNVVQPDICVICDLHKIDEKGCNGAPDLIVEIVSKSSVQKDLHEKYEIYEKYCVKEYWVVYPHDKSLTIFVLNSEGRYQPQKPLTRGDIAKSNILEGFEIDLDEVFRDIMEEPEDSFGEKIERI